MRIRMHFRLVIPMIHGSAKKMCIRDSADPVRRDGSVIPMTAAAGHQIPAIIAESTEKNELPGSRAEIGSGI